MNIPQQLLIILLLTIVNAFFSMSEMAIISINRNRLKILIEQGNLKAMKLERLLEEPTMFLSTIQVGITLAGFLSSAFAASSISTVLASYWEGKIPYAQELSLVLVTLLLSYLTLVLGELVPKRIALKNPEKISLRVAGIIQVIRLVLQPFVWLLTETTNLVLRMFGMLGERMEERVSKEEIRSLVEVGQEHGVINETEVEMINSIFEFDNKTAEEVMTPRRDVYMIDITRPLPEFIDELIEYRYSRVPVFEGTSDHCIGILFMKDFLVEARRVGFEQVDLRSILQPAYFVPERKNIDALFKELQSIKRHMALLIDEHGGFSGIVTIEDLIEEVMGEIDDEFDEEEVRFSWLQDGVALVAGNLSIAALNEAMDLSFAEDSDDFDTVGGLLLKELGYIPSDDSRERVELEGVNFQILEIHDKRILQVLVKLQPDRKNEDNSELKTDITNK
ncbi:MAG: hemolysin family protein [Erysipelotrichaceae bacterium]